MAEIQNEQDTARRGFRRKLVGTVKSDKMDKTVMVEVVRRLLEPKYKKYVRVRRHFKAHDETNQYRIGDRVEIQEARPLSRTKRWVVTRLIAASVDREQ
jgi:small subunit ribosomal protein S17